MSSDHEPQSAVFDRVFSSISRARRELSINSQDNLLSSTRRLFRRHITSRTIRPPGRQENAVWQIHLFLLPGPDIEVLPSASALDRFGNLGLGRPVQESSGTGTQKSKIQLNWTLSELNNFVCQSYPNVSLNLTGFHLARAGKGRKIDKVHVDSVRDLKKAIGKSRLYIVPRAEVLQEMTPSSSISQNPVQTSCTTAALDDTSLDAETTEAVNLDSLQEWRAMRSQQDEEFNFSLLADQEKDRRRLCYELLEEQRKKIIEERRQRMAARVEPLEGEFLKFKYQDGYVNKRKFIMSEPIQVLFDFIGQNEMASEVFQVQEAASSKAIESSSSGSIADHGIKSSSTLYVLWLSSLADLAPVAPSPAQPSVATPPVQHPFAPSSDLPPVALPSVHPSISPPLAQPSVPSHSVIPLLTLPPIQHPAAASPAQPTAASSPALPPVALPYALPSVASLSAIPLVARSPVQHPVALPPAQSSLALSSVQLPYVISEDQPLPCRPSAQPNIIDLDMQPTLDLHPPSPQGSVIDLLDDAPSFHQESPLHWEAPVDEVDLQTILKKLLCKVDKSFCPTSNQINVCRDNILQCSLQAFKRRRFNPEAKLDIVFVDAEENGEGAVDEGGPTREYLRLLMRAIHQSSIFQGHEKDQSLALDTQALQTRLYSFMGKMIAVCVAHGGVCPHFFSERLFHQICGVPTSPASVDEVGDHTFREQLIKIQDAKTVLEANCAIAEAADSLSIIGALRYISNLTEKNSLVQSAVDFFVHGRLQAALDQFVEGLQTLGLLEEMQKNSALFYDMFVNEEKPLQAKDLCSLFKVNFSPQGSNRRARENKNICHWRDWLIDVEEGECNAITLQMIMEFATGASSVPPLGFPYSPQIEFLHDHGKIFPEANTCLVVLRLPIHAEYEMFKRYMTDGIVQSPTFGVV